MDKIALAAECLVISTGLYPSKPIDRAHIKAAIGVPLEMEAEVKAFLARDKPARQLKIPEIDYLRAWKKLNTSQQHDELIALIGDPSIGAAYLNKLDDARKYLVDHWRPTRLMTLVGPKILPPATSEDQRCQALYAVANDARRSVGRLASCSVLAEEMHVVRTVFPEFYGMVSDMIKLELQRLSLRRATYEPKFWQETSAALYLGEPIAGGVTTINEDTIPPENSAPPEIDIATNRDKNATMTKADRVDSGVPA